MKNIWPKIAAGLGLGLAVIIGLALLADLRAVTTQILTFQWGYAPLILALTLFNYGLRFIKWHYYIRQIGAHTLRWRDSARLFVGGFPLALSPGKLAEPLKAVWLRQYTGLPVARGIPVVAAERLSDGLAVLLLSTFGVIAYPQYWPGFLAVLAGMLGLIGISQIKPLALGLIGLGERVPLMARFSHHLREFYAGTYQLFGPKSTLVGVGLGLVSWLGEGVGFYFVLRGLGLPPSGRLLAMAVFGLSFSTIVGAVSSLPGGLGAAEASLTGMLMLTLNPGEGLAASAALLIRFFTLWFGVGLGLLVLMFSRHLLTFDLPPATSPGLPPS